ncbi:MAG: helix-turn-helix domain-containing protein [Candidatus Binatia bacterium]
MAIILKIHLKTVYRLAGGGKIPGNRISSTWRIRRSNILDLLFRQMEERQHKLGKGTVLGLSIPHGIVAVHGGGIRYEPVESGGARFLFLCQLPL